MTVRIQIRSEDRAGISQEILTVLAKINIDISALEVQSECVFMQLRTLSGYKFSDIKQRILQINGVYLCDEIALLPSEKREHQLNVLINRLPDAIVYVDEKLAIITSNHAADQLLLALPTCQQKQITEPSALKKHKISTLIDIDLTFPLSEQTLVKNITISGKNYIAELSQTLSKQGVTGAVICLKSMNSLGKQITMLQNHDGGAVENIIGNSTVIQTLTEQVIKFSALDLPVLINGETGTGKELIARALHYGSTRAKHPFLAINCASLPEHLLESELFGYASGAFTGARQGGKPGLIELAEGGTLFLDEIAEMSVYLQAKLLRFLEDFKYRRVGGTQELTANVRIVSATHKHLSAMITEQKFRQDLFYRLNVLNLYSPALRERKSDIPLLVAHFIQLAAKQMNKVTPQIDQQALSLLHDQHWHGNVRELQNVLFRTVALSEQTQISLQEIKIALDQCSQQTIQAKKLDDDMIIDWKTAQENFEKQLLSSLYPYYSTTRKLAERLNVSHNKIAMKLKRYNIS